MARVVLFHASPDESTVRRIATALREAGHDAWLDDQTLDRGATAVERSPHEADVVVICVSKAANEGWLEPRPMSVLQFRRGKGTALSSSP